MTEKNAPMNNVVQSTAGWLALPELILPTLAFMNEEGVRYVVQRVGFLAVDADECQCAGIAAESGAGGKRLLPTAMIEFSGISMFSRLPVELSSWAIEYVNAAHAGQLRFSATIEFGQLTGRKYAEFV